MNRKNPAAVALGRLGRQANTTAQKAASRANGKRGGRPLERTRCPRCEAARRTCYHLEK